jgi:hypothetical protein
MSKNIIITTIVFIMLFVVILSSCNTPNIMHRNAGSKECFKDNCDKALIEKHRKEKENYDLTFIEFTERGNLFDRTKLNKVLKHIETEKEENKNGIMLLVYIHGWKHNASNASNGDVRKFRRLLKIVNNNQINDKKVIGVYIGWRGLTLNIEPFKTLTYWGRKNVARQVGNGGVSEVLLRLEKIVKNKTKLNKNIFVIAGHSFGAAVISAAMKDILISKVVNIEKVDKCNTVSNYKKDCKDGCYKTESFGDGIILLNPAIEANEFVQIKELITEKKCYTREQPKLMHILSSDSDKATKGFFKPGQILGVSITEAEEELERDIFSVDQEKNCTKEKNCTIILNEYELDTTTIGNYSPFRTARSKNRQDINEKHKHLCMNKTANLTECFIPCRGKNECVGHKDKHRHFPVSPFEPLSVVYTDADFMKSHTDIFNETVTAYMISAVIENQFKQNKDIYKNKDIPCFKEKTGNRVFYFSNCLEFFREKYRKDFDYEYNSSD